MLEDGFDPSAPQPAITAAGTGTGTGTGTGAGAGTVTGTVSSESELIQKAFVQKCFRTGAGGGAGSGRKKRQTQSDLRGAADAVAAGRSQSSYDDLVLDIFLNPAKLAAKDQLRMLLSNLTRQFFEAADMAAAYPNLFKLLWYSNIPCFKNNVTEAYLLKKCVWQGVEHSCSDLFKQVPTDSGGNFF